MSATLDPAPDFDAPIRDLVRRDFTAVEAHVTVDEALRQLRTQPLGEKIVYIYVTEADRRLVGVLPTRRLLMSDPSARVADVMLRKVVTLPAAATVLEACEFFIQHRFLALPVVDERQHLIGVIDVSLFTDEVFDVAEEQARRDLFQLLGLSVERQRKFSAPARFAERFPWLLCNIGGGMLCALVTGAFMGVLDEVLVLALFMPVVLALGESVSIQSTTIVLQELHHQRFDLRTLAWGLSRELLVAGLLGLACGATVALLVTFWPGPALVPLAVGVSILCSILAACAFGFLLPTLVRALEADPKIAAGPIALALTDLATLTFYFLLASLLLI